MLPAPTADKVSAFVPPINVKLAAPGSLVSVKLPVNADASIVVIVESRAAVIVKAEPPEILSVEVRTPST